MRLVIIGLSILLVQKLVEAKIDRSWLSQMVADGNIDRNWLKAVNSRLHQAAAGMTPTNPASSCTEVFINYPEAPPGFYWVKSFNTAGISTSVYCNSKFTASCGGSAGGWTRVAHLDMTDKTQTCPDSLRELNYFGTRACAISTDEAGCSSDIFESPIGEYYEICGKIIGYQVGTPDTFGDSGRGESPSIDTYYVDGVSLTIGSPRTHLWTFVAGLDEDGEDPQYNCACTNPAQASDSVEVPPFVGDDYFCDTGDRDGLDENRFYGNDPLWDGAGCGMVNTCCAFNEPPWFYQELAEYTTDAIEMRVCRDQDTSNEDVLISRVDIYIR